MNVKCKIRKISKVFMGISGYLYSRRLDLIKVLCSSKNIHTCSTSHMKDYLRFKPYDKLYLKPYIHASQILMMIFSSY